MPLQFTVPQFIDVEDKIIGPISVRQFLVILGGGIMVTACYFIFTFIPFIIISVVLLGITAMFAFYRINGQPFHVFLLNILTTSRRPRLKVWHKHLADEDIRMQREKSVDLSLQAPSSKPTPSTSRLQELSLIVDTGGAYGEESWEVARENDLL
ncbi:MAG: PrgI family protein [Patescibacteria group bacterium]|jgi:hypothetical protein